MRYILLLLCCFSLCVCHSAETSKEIIITRLLESGNIWLDKYSTKQEQATWLKSWQEILSEYGEVSEDSFTRDYLFNYCIDHKKNIKHKQKLVIIMLFKYTIAHNLNFHSKILEALTEENSNKIILELEKD
jgi:hypothetical protein